MNPLPVISNFLLVIRLDRESIPTMIIPDSDPESIFLLSFRDAGEKSFIHVIPAKAGIQFFQPQKTT